MPTPITNATTFKSLFSRRGLLLLITLLLVFGSVRNFTLVLWRPVCGYADNSDMVRMMAAFDLWPVEGGRECVHYRATARQYAFADFGSECTIYSSQMLLMAPVVAVMRAMDHFSPNTLFDIRSFGFSHSLALCILATAYCVFFWRSGRKKAALLNALMYAVLLTDPLNTLFFNGHFQETSSLIFAYFAVLAGMDLCMGGPARARSLTFALAILLLGTTKQQHLPTALMFGAFFYAATWYYWCRPGYSLTAGLAMATIVAVVFNAWNSSRQDGLVIAIARANKTDAVFGAILPMTKDPARALQQLGLPQDHKQFIGKTWYDPGMGTHIPHAKVFDVSRKRLLRLFWDDPTLLWRLTDRGIKELETGRTGLFGKDGMNYYYLRYSEGNLYDRPPFPNISQLFFHFGRPAYLFLFFLPLLLLPYSLVKILRGWRSRQPGVEVLLLLFCLTAYACFYITIIGDGYWEFGKHNHLTFNLLLAVLAFFIILIASWFITIISQKHICPLPLREEPELKADSIEKATSLSAFSPVSRGLTAGGTIVLLFFVLICGVTVAFAEHSSFPESVPTDSKDRLPVSGAVERRIVTPRGNLQLSGWAYDFRSGSLVQRIVLVDKGRVLPVRDFYATLFVKPDIYKPEYDRWSASIPARYVRNHENWLPEVYALFHDGQWGRIPATLTPTPIPTE